MNSIEQELRLKVTSDELKKIEKITSSYKDNFHMIDVTMGKYGFESLKKTGCIYRVRNKNGNYFVEVKKYISKDECIEKNMKVESLQEGINYLTDLGLNIYLILDRYREVRKFNELLIYIDKFEDLGNFIEIEYQNATKKEALDFIDSLNIEMNFQEKYGDIVRKKIDEDEIYKEKYLEKIEIYKKQYDENLKTHKKK